MDTVVEYIRSLRGVDRVHLVGWSAGSFRVGPYAARHPEKVASLFLFSAIFNANFRGPPPIADPTPMTIGTFADAFAGWDTEQRCEDQRAPGIKELVWAAIMENDDLGRSWGPPEGVMRVRQAVNRPFAFNADVARRITAPTLIIRGDLDNGQGGLQQLAELYALIQNDNKLRFTVECTGHYMQWESRRHVLHQVSKEWFNLQRVYGRTRGEYGIDKDGNLVP
jgi:pimeloyl-ACP methyl ester carboxylesterase